MPALFLAVAPCSGVHATAGRQRLAIHVRASLNEQLDGRRIGAKRGRGVERRRSTVVDAADIGLLLEEQPDDSLVVLRRKLLAVDTLHREVQRGVALVVLDVDLGARIDQGGDDLERGRRGRRCCAGASSARSAATPASVRRTSDGSSFSSRRSPLTSFRSMRSTACSRRAFDDCAASEMTTREARSTRERGLRHLLLVCHRARLVDYTRDKCGYLAFSNRQTTPRGRRLRRRAESHT